MGKRERLIECAIRLFAADGINATSTGAIAKAAGVAAGTLFNYFATKEELIKSAYVECKKGMACTIQADVDPELRFETMIRTTWSRAIAWSLEHPERHDFMHQFAGLPDWHDEVLEEQLAAEMKFFHTALDAAQQRGEVVRLDVRYLQTLFAAWYDGTVRYIRTIPPAERPALIDASIEMFWRALSPGSTAPVSPVPERKKAIK